MAAPITVTATPPRQGDRVVLGTHWAPSSAAGPTAFVGAGHPPQTLGLAGDTYTDTTAGRDYVRVDGRWSLTADYVPQHRTGHGPPAAELGFRGDTYTDLDADRQYARGPNGWTVTADHTPQHFTGAGAPARLVAYEGDTYTDTAAGDQYAYRSGAWEITQHYQNVEITGDGPPDANTGGYNGDTYWNNTAGDRWTKTNGQWVLTAAHVPVATSGAYAPSSTAGKYPGDTYTDLITRDVYTFTAGRGWVLTTAGGPIHTSGVGPPPAGYALEGDTYTDTATQDVYRFTNHTWTLTGHTPQHLTGHGPPAPALGALADTYTDLDRDDHYHKATTGWALDRAHVPTNSSGAGAPSSTAGKYPNDRYTDTVSGDGWTVSAAGVWEKTSPHVPVATSGDGPPAANLAGYTGDTYTDNLTRDVYTKDALGVWNKTETGQPQHLTGAGAPAAELGITGDTYTDTATNRTYTKTASGWTEDERATRHTRGRGRPPTGVDPHAVEGDIYHDTTWIRAPWYDNACRDGNEGTGQQKLELIEWVADATGTWVNRTADTDPGGAGYVRLPRVINVERHMAAKGLDGQYTLTPTMPKPPLTAAHVAVWWSQDAGTEPIQPTMTISGQPAPRVDRVQWKQDASHPTVNTFVSGVVPVGDLDQYLAVFVQTDPAAGDQPLVMTWDGGTQIDVIMCAITTLVNVADVKRTDERPHGCTTTLPAQTPHVARSPAGYGIKVGTPVWANTTGLDDRTFMSMLAGATEVTLPTYVWQSTGVKLNADHPALYTMWHNMNGHTLDHMRYTRDLTPDVGAGNHGMVSYLQKRGVDKEISLDGPIAGYDANNNPPSGTAWPYSPRFSFSFAFRWDTETYYMSANTTPFSYAPFPPAGPHVARAGAPAASVWSTTGPTSGQLATQSGFGLAQKPATEEWVRTDTRFRPDHLAGVNVSFWGTYSDPDPENLPPAPAPPADQHDAPAAPPAPGSVVVVDPQDIDVFSVAGVAEDYAEGPWSAAGLPKGLPVSHHVWIWRKRDPYIGDGSTPEQKYYPVEVWPVFGWSVPQVEIPKRNDWGISEETILVEIYGPPGFMSNLYHEATRFDFEDLPK